MVNDEFLDKTSTSLKPSIPDLDESGDETDFVSDEIID